MGGRFPVENLKIRTSWPRPLGYFYVFRVPACFRRQATAKEMAAKCDYLLPGIYVPTSKKKYTLGVYSYQVPGIYVYCTHTP